MHITVEGDISPRRDEEHEGHEGRSAGIVARGYRRSDRSASPRRTRPAGSVYEVALCKELWLQNVSVERQVSVPVSYKGEVLGCHVKLDLLVDKTVVVEVKAIDKLMSIHTAQLLTYLRLQNLWLGLLINFNVNSLRDGCAEF